MHLLSDCKTIASSYQHQLRTICWVATLVLANGFLHHPFRQPPTFAVHGRGSRTQIRQQLAAPTTLQYANVQPQQQNGNVEHLKESVDIVDVVESYNLPKFHRRGAGAVALCPFHDDNNPSLSIDSSRQCFKCFSCGAGGDVFKFVQDYSKLPGNDELSFGQVLELVSTQFGDGEFKLRSDGLSTEERDALRQKKERIILANTFAANFYSKCLTQPFAGGARFHLRSRKISTVTLCRCLLGYAPDCYFGQQNGASPGQGGLVEHLEMLNFTVTEIVDAGLATPRKRNREMNVTELNHGMLVDRFRGRLMVPIFDAAGKRILAFGGREIKPPSDSDELDSITVPSFKAPKYLNSPESLVFEKRKVLFGRSNAASTIQLSAGPPTLLIVEGYMDAISLWNADIGATVATMGTAVTEQQMDAAAKLVAPSHGRVVLCLDNDQAGEMATERLCTNGILSAVSQRRKVEFFVAQFPPGVKDPAEFLESYGEATPTSGLANLFTDKVVDKALEWTEWYVQRLMKQYDPSAPRGTAGSFQDLFERIASYLASALEPPDRTKVASEVSHRLSSLLAIETEAFEPSPSVRAQLETDLVELSAKVARDKESLRRRVTGATVDPVSQTEETKVVQRLLNGGSSTSRLSPKLRRPPSIVDKERSTGNPPRVKRRVTKLKRQPEPASLTPHFGGLEWAHKTDRAWLGVSSNGKKKKYDHVLGHRREFGGTQNDIVYFGSADYNGHQFLTPDAQEAGYTLGTMRPDRSVIKYGLASLLVNGSEDAGLAKQAAEDSLLHILVQHESVRSSARDMLHNTIGKLTDGSICWSCAEKKWLFHRILDEQSVLPPDCSSNSTALKLFLASQNDAPDNAFSDKDNDTIDDPVLSISDSKNVSRLPTASVGILDKFFDAIQDDPELPTNANSGQRTELVAQELLVSLFSISKTERLKHLSDSIVLRVSNNSQSAPNLPLTLNGAANGVPVAVNGIQEDVLIVGESRNTTLANSNETSPLVLSSEDLQAISELQKATTEVLSWKKSESHITSRLVDKNREYGDEGQLPESLQSGVATTVKDHWMTMVKGGKDQEQNNVNPEEGFSAPGDEPFEDGLERLQEEYGDWYDDDYFWSPGDSAKMDTPPEAELLTVFGDGELAEGEESLEEFTERIDREFAHWDLS